MKKLFAALIASVLLLPALSTTAFAGDSYPGTVRTSMKISAPKSASAGQVFEVKSTLKVKGSGGPCRGTMVVTVSKKGKAKVRSTSVPPTSATFKFRLGSVGPWKIKASFKPNGSSPCKASSKKRTITIR